MTERLDDLDWPAGIRLEYGALADGNPSVITILRAPDWLFRDDGAGLIQTMIGPEAFLATATVLAERR